MTGSGELRVVGTGIRLAGQLTEEARALVRGSDRVFAVMAEPLALELLRELNPRVSSLQVHYRGGRTRDESYERMVEALLEPVRAGERVCAAFYGHPGVFVWPAHEAVRRARAEGLDASMTPGISAEDCLFADLGWDPGVHGCQSYEAADFLVYARRIDPSALLILWQLAALGDISRSTFRTDPEWVRVLADVLAEDYGEGHRVTIYEAASFPLDEARIEEVALSELSALRFTQASTLVVPPLRAPRASLDRLERLGVRKEDLVTGAFQRHRG
ncbi:MAG: SAM-dependent methyltransferase [Wenzhouxiangellaceae bacterium]|nr:SAM-dependent methyltransferase [Wenzhouxiangellaceae bacterium]